MDNVTSFAFKALRESTLLTSTIEKCSAVIPT